MIDSIAALRILGGGHEMRMILGSILLMAAGSTMGAEDLAGNYELVGEREAASQLTLKPDGTFEFGLMYGAADFWGSGKWYQEKSTVVLNSTSKLEPPFRLMRSAAGKDTHIRIWVIGQNGRGIANIKVILRSAEGELVTQTLDDGLAEFPPVQGKREVVFRVQVYGVETEAQTLAPADGSFYFEINGKGIQEFRFDNQRARVNGNTLELRIGDGEHSLRYKKR
jgi:hypothetical protein